MPPPAVTSRSPRIWPAAPTTPLASVLDCTVTPMGSRMLKRWLHMPVRDTAVLVERQQTIGALQERYTELQPVLRQVGDLERILARLALRTARPR